MIADEIRVSVCIPTCDRPDMLRQCIESALAQTRPPFEIVVGDDSRDHRSEALVAELASRSAVPIRYQRNAPCPGLNRNACAARNIASVFERASGDWLHLVHDDDWLLPRATELLTEPLRNGVGADIVYGDHLVAHHDGSIDPEASENANPAYGRLPERAGLQPSSLWAAVRQQMPTSYMVRKTLVTQLGYLSPGVSDGEFTFGVRCALAGARLFYIPEPVYVYRMSLASLGRNNHSGGTSAVDAVSTIWRHRSQILDVCDRELLRHVRDVVYRGSVSACRFGRRRDALKWSVHPRLGLGREWFGRRGFGVLSAMMLSYGLRERLKRSLVIDPFRRSGRPVRERDHPLP